MDSMTRRAPILPVLMLVAGYDAKQASKQVGRILNDPRRTKLKELVGPPIRVNGCGNACYCATGELVHRLLMCLPPGRFTDDYMAECARVLYMRDVGDPRLIAELQNNRAAAIANGGIPRMDALFGPAVPDITQSTITGTCPELVVASNKRSIAMMEADVEERQLAIAERRRENDQQHRNAQLRMLRESEEVNLLHAERLRGVRQGLEDLDLLDDHGRMAIRDSMFNYDAWQIVTLNGTCVLPPHQTGASGPPDAMLMNTTSPAPTVCGPLHSQPSNLLQIHEILEIRMGVPSLEAAQMSNTFGRDIAPRYRAKYSVDEPPKKYREINGLMKEVNAYPPCDWPWIEARLTEIIPIERARLAAIALAKQQAKNKKHKKDK